MAPERTIANFDQTRMPGAASDQTRMPGAASDADVTGFGTPPPPAYRTPRPPSADDMTRAPDAANPSASAGPLAIGQMFGPRYRIMKLLGIGGMGAVYQAWDHDLDVVVALKVIRPEATSDPAEIAAIERRFKQELLLARQVTHKNVVRIHDLGEIDGIKYITMSYIQGADLATVLQRDGKLTVPAAMNLTRQITSGLLAAHEAGVVHRDLKPANIMIEADHAIIMDFGIARSSGGPQTPITPSQLPSPRSKSIAQTMAGSIVGTITYMAPEQAKGEPVDQRADMYALGMIMSDMLLGLRRRNTDSAIEDLQRRITERPEPLRKADPSVPVAFDQIVSRLLEPDPAKRFQTTAELMSALDRLDDNAVPLPLIRRLTPRLIATAAVIMIALLGGTYYITSIIFAPPVQHDPVSVVIADFQNNTNDPAFNSVLEPMLKRALEGAGFVTAYDRIRLLSLVGVRAPEKLDEVAAREIAVKQGFGVIVAGVISPAGSGYNVSIKALQAVTGNVLATGDRNAASKDDVLAAATRLAQTVRTGLGDETSESDQIFAATSLSATSLDVVRRYVAGMEAQSNGKPEEARQNFTAAIEADPKFGIAYTSLAASLRNLGRRQEAEKYLNESLRYLDSMTERERLSTRAYFFLATGDFQSCIKQYGDLIARYEADVVGRNQRAYCMTKLRDMSGAVEQMRYVVNLLPNRTIFRMNLALYANYASAFDVAEEETKSLPPSAEHTNLALAMSQVGRDRIPEASATYEKLNTLSALGATFSGSGLADIAVTQGRYADAVRMLEQRAAAELTAKNVDAAANKYAALAYAELSRGNNKAAVSAADKALANSKSVKIRFLAARTYIEAGAAAKARPVIKSLAEELQVESQAHAQILEGVLALKNGDARQAIKMLTDANTQLDTWIGRYDLARANFAAGAYVQADSEIERCIKRRGEAISLFVDEDPSFGYFPSVYYLQGRIREALKTAGAADSYKQYLTFRGQSKEDPLIEEVRRKAAG